MTDPPTALQATESEARNRGRWRHAKRVLALGLGLSLLALLVAAPRLAFRHKKLERRIELVQVSFDITASNGELVVDYVVTNRGFGPALVFDRGLRMPQQTDESLDDWVDVVGDEEHNALVLRRVIVPPTMCFCGENEAPPLARRVEAHEQVRGRIAIPIPARRTSDVRWSGASGNEADAFLADQVVLEIGYVLGFRFEAFEERTRIPDLGWEHRGVSRVRGETIYALGRDACQQYEEQLIARASLPLEIHVAAD